MCVVAMLLAVTPIEVPCGGVVEVDLGVMEGGVPHEVDVTLVCAGSSPWSADRVVVSCPACVEVVSYPRALRAGERGRVGIRVKPDLDAGLQRWGAAIAAVDGPPTRIRLGGEVPGLAASPGTVVLDVAAEPSAVVGLSWHGPAPPDAVTATTRSSWLQVSVLREESGRWRLDVRVQADHLPARRSVHEAAIEIHAAAGGGPIVELPVRCIRPGSASTAPIFLGCGRPGSRMERALRVPWGDAVPIAAMPGLRVSSHKRDGDQIVVSLAWTCPRATAGRVDGVLHWQSQDSGRVLASQPLFAFALPEAAP